MRCTGAGPSSSNGGAERFRARFGQPRAAGRHVPWVTWRGLAGPRCRPSGPAARSSGSARRLPGRGERWAGGCSRWSRKPRLPSITQASGACARTSVTHGGLISPGGTEEPEKPDMAQFSLTKDEKWKKDAFAPAPPPVIARLQLRRCCCWKGAAGALRAAPAPLLLPTMVWAELCFPKRNL